MYSGYDVLAAGFTYSQSTGYLVELLESDISRVLTEALTAKVEAILSNQTMSVGTCPAR